MLKALEIEEVEVVLNDRKDSKKIVNELLEKHISGTSMNENGKPILYQPIISYDEFNGVNRTVEYYNALKNIVDFLGEVKDRKILDVGSCYGFFCFQLARKGAYMIGVDSDHERIAISLHLNNIYGFDWSNPKFITSYIANYIRETGLSFDYALLINVLHNMIGQHEPLAWDTLNRLARKSKKIVLSMSHVSPVETARSQYEIPELVVSKTILNKYDFLGSLGGRYLYGFWRE